MEVRSAELQTERELLEATPPEDLFTMPTQMVPDQSALITVADEQRGHLPNWGRTHDSDTEEAYYVLIRTMVEDDNYGLDSTLRCGRKSKVVLSEQQHMILDAHRVTTMRVNVAAAAKRAAVVKEDDLLAKADSQANPDKVSKALYTELQTWFDNMFQDARYSYSVEQHDFEM
eukprot:1525857-Pyramimonas_sp.AAC.1